MTGLRQTKLAVVGAGSVGASLAYAAVIRGIAREVTLYDIRADKARAEALDIAHGVPFAGNIAVTGGDDIALVEDADVVVLTAGAQMAVGESRLTLAEKNTRIFEQLLPPIVERAPDAIYIVVTNPCDILTVVGQRVSGLPPTRIFASGTALDSSRLRAELAGRLGVAASSVHALVVGEHGDSELPLWSHAAVGATPIADWRDERGACLAEEHFQTIARDVARAGYEVMAGKGTSNFAIGLCGVRIAEAALRDERVILPVSSIPAGARAGDGIALSLPSVVGAAGVVRVLDTPMTDDEARGFAASAQVVRAALADVGY